MELRHGAAAACKLLVMAKTHLTSDPDAAPLQQAPPTSYPNQMPSSSRMTTKSLIKFSLPPKNPLLPASCCGSVQPSTSDRPPMPGWWGGQSMAEVSLGKAAARHVAAAASAAAGRESRPRRLRSNGVAARVACQLQGTEHHKACSRTCSSKNAAAGPQSPARRMSFPPLVGRSPFFAVSKPPLIQARVGYPARLHT